MYGMTPMGVFFTAIFPLEINEQVLCQQPHIGPKWRKLKGRHLRGPPFDISPQDKGEMGTYCFFVPSRR